MESHEGLSPGIETAITIKEVLRETLRRGYPLEIPGYTVGEPPVESKYRLISGGAIEIVELVRTEMEEPLMRLVQNDSEQGGRTYALTITTEDNGILKRVRYNKDGRKESIEIIGPWQSKKHNLDELGMCRFEDLPENIEPKKVARELLEGLRTRTFKQASLVNKAIESKEEKSRVMIRKAA